MKVCAVLGYGPGIGAAVARRWSQGGYAVALVSRTKEKLDAAASEIPNAKVGSVLKQDLFLCLLADVCSPRHREPAGVCVSASCHRIFMR